MFQFMSLTTTGSAGFDTGIGDLALKTFNGQTYLYAASGVNGGITAWRLQSGGSPVLHDDQTYASSITTQVARKIMPVTIAGSENLALDVDTATGLVSYTLNSNGSVGALRETVTLSGGGDIDALTQVAGAGNGFLAIAHDQTDRIATYRIESDGTLTLIGSQAGQAVALKTLETGGSTYVVAADPVSHNVVAYGIDTNSGTLSTPSTSGAEYGLGLADITAIEVVQAYGEAWVIVAASGSNSLSVMRLGIDGRLVPTDHLLDTLSTRFEKVQDLALVQVQDRVFVVAGGGDDGLSLFTLTPHGKLIYLDSFADTNQSGLQNVEAIAAAYVGTDLQIFASSQEEAGLTQMSVSLASLGYVVQGRGTVTGSGRDDMITGLTGDATLSGGAGNDILIAATGTTTMSGGTGADIFVMRDGSGTTTITDFEAGTDRLDLFDFPMLRNVGQLSIATTGQGAQITYQGNTIVITSASGTPLDAGTLFGGELSGPDHVPIVGIGGGGGGGGGTPAISLGSPGVVGPVTVATGTVNAALSDAEVRFTPSGGSTVTAQADANGNFDLGLSGSSTGTLDIVKSYSTASAEITALDALQVLRIAVGLDPTWGAASPLNLIAADITRDGTINALDALDVLRAAVGIEGTSAPEWLFLDANADLSGITPTSVNYNTGTTVTATDGSFSTEMHSLLLGNMEAY